MTPDIEVRNLHLRYRDSVAIHDLTFTLDGGKIYGLLGRNGAGKTSLLSVLAGFRLASGGAVRVGGEDPFDNPRVAPQTCFVRETLDFVESVRVRDTLAFARRFRPDRKSTRLNSSHSQISYAVFCLKKKKDPQIQPGAAESLYHLGRHREPQPSLYDDGRRITRDQQSDVEGVHRRHYAQRLLQRPHP